MGSFGLTDGTYADEFELMNKRISRQSFVNEILF